MTTPLPTNIEATRPDYGDADILLHQQSHDRIHGKVNGLDSGGLVIASSAAAVIPLVVKGAASQTANLLEARDSAGVLKAVVLPGGRVKGTFVQAGDLNNGGVGYLDCIIPAAAERGLVVRGAASQTANLAEFQNSAGTIVSAITSDGALVISPPASSNALHVVSSSGGIGIRSDAGTATAIPLRVRGAASQTANLAEFQNSAGTVVLGVTATGLLNVTSAFASATAGSSGAVPAQVIGYLAVQVNGVERRVPYFAV